MEKKLKTMKLTPKNYFAAGFMHDFYFKDPGALSLTLMSEYMKKLNYELSI